MILQLIVENTGGGGGSLPCGAYSLTGMVHIKLIIVSINIQFTLTPVLKRKSYVAL